MRVPSLVVSLGTLLAIAAGFGALGQLLLGLNAALVAEVFLTAIACAVALRWPSRGLWLFLAGVVVGDLAKRLLFIPRANVTQLEYQLALALPDAILLALVAGLILRWNVRTFTGRLRLTDFSVLLYVAWLALALWRPDSSLFVGLVGAKLSGIYVALYFVGATLVGTPDRFRKLARWTVWLGVPAALYGLWQAIFGYSWFEERWLISGLTAIAAEGTLDLGGIHRIFSTFASHEQLGFYLAVAVLLVPAGGFQAPRRRLYVLLGAVLLRSLSRSSWIAFFVAWIFPRLVHRPGRRKRLLKLGLAVLLAGAVALQAVFFISRAAPEGFLRRATTLGTYEARVQTFELLIDDSTYRTPFGNGLGSMWGAWRLGENSAIPIVSHSGVVDILYELGWVGLLVFGLVSASCLASVLKTLDHAPPDSLKRQAALVCGGFVVAVLVVNAFVATLLILRPIAVYFWLFLGIASRVGRWPDDGVMSDE